MSFDASGISTIGSAAVTTVGTLAVTGAALKTVGKVAGGMNRGGGRTRSNRTRKVSSGRRSSRKSSYSIWS